VPRFFTLVCSVVLASLLSAAGTTAQTIRFHTTLGPFDVLLNPTGASELQPYIDGFLQYVNSGAYEGVVINRADEGFVVQLGIYTTSATTTAEVPSGGFDDVPALDPVIVDSNNDGDIDFNTSPFSNMRGTVAFALRAGDVNSSTSSFFVNLGSNSFLDSQGFVPFASISDMSLFDQIDALDRVDLTDEIGEPNNPHYTDIPVVNGNQLLFIEQVTVVPEPTTVTLAALVLALAIRARKGHLR
jgi:peptidyl-prolyl cis-trans isomerase A (cyclophilin A)